MNRLLVLLLLSGLSALSGTPVLAVLTCTIASAGWSTVYNDTVGTNNTPSASLTVTCQRSAGGDPTTVSYTVRVDNGVNAAAAQNRARLGAGANLINYENHRNGSCSALWGNTAATDIQGTITFTNNGDFSSRNQLQPFWGCVPPLQTAKPAGVYTDSVTMTLRRGGTILNTSAFPATIIVPATCSFPTAPGTVAFTYTAFQAGASNASTGFQVRCNNQLPYSLSVGAATEVVGGLQYSLAISPLGPYSGTGFAQPFTINGTMPGGQAGTCGAGNCLATQPRTLTVTY